MGGTGVIDNFLGIFTSYIDSGFGLLGGEVAFIATTLIVIDVTLAALFWTWGADDDIIARLVKKTIFVGIFAYLISNWNMLARIVFESFSGLSKMFGLRHDEGPGIETGGGEERDPLVVAGLVARVLAVSDQEHPAVYVEVAPVRAADLVQPHRGGDGELHDPRHGHRQARIRVKAAEEAAQFSGRRASVTLDTLADETKPLQRYAGPIDAFNANF